VGYRNVRQRYSRKTARLTRTIQSDIESLLPTDDSVPTVLTVRCRINDTDLSTTDNDDYRLVLARRSLDVLNRAIDATRRPTPLTRILVLALLPKARQSVLLFPYQVGRVVGHLKARWKFFQSNASGCSARPPLLIVAKLSGECRRCVLFSKVRTLSSAVCFAEAGLGTYTPVLRWRTHRIKSWKHYIPGVQCTLDSKRVHGQFMPRWRELPTRSRKRRSSSSGTERRNRFYVVSYQSVTTKHHRRRTLGGYLLGLQARKVLVDGPGPTLSPNRGGFRTYDLGTSLIFPTRRGQARNVAFGKIVGHTIPTPCFATVTRRDDFRRIVDHRLIVRSTT